MATARKPKTPTAKKATKPRAPRRLRNGGVAHELTPEERLRGIQNSAANRAALKAEARALAVERLAGMTEQALTNLQALLETDGEKDIRAIREVLDRILGKPQQEVELHGKNDGPVEIKLTFDHAADADS